jgi:hypothetical protein
MSLKMGYYVFEYSAGRGCSALGILNKMLVKPTKKYTICCVFKKQFMPLYQKFAKKLVPLHLRKQWDGNGDERDRSEAPKHLVDVSADIIFF